jgi:hypothetical protein
MGTSGVVHFEKNQKNLNFKKKQIGGEPFSSKIISRLTPAMWQVETHMREDSAIMKEVRYWYRS